VYEVCGEARQAKGFRLLTSKLARQGVEEVKLPILRRDVLVASHDEGFGGRNNCAGMCSYPA